MCQAVFRPKFTSDNESQKKKLSAIVNRVIIIKN